MDLLEARCRFLGAQRIASCNSAVFVAPQAQNGASRQGNGGTRVELTRLCFAAKASTTNCCDRSPSALFIGVAPVGFLVLVWLELYIWHQQACSDGFSQDLNPQKIATDRPCTQRVRKLQNVQPDYPQRATSENIHQLVQPHQSVIMDFITEAISEAISGRDNGPEPPYVQPPWVARWDNEAERWIFVNEATGERSWEKPVFEEAGACAVHPPACGGSSTRS